MTDLPDDIALLWGLREAPRRGRKPSLTAADLTRAAIEVADAEGLAAVSMARVAKQLGNATMALYRHVRSKEELLLLMTDAAIGYPPDLPSEGTWRDKLTFWSQSVMACLREHPWYAQIPFTGPPAGPNNLAWFDRGLASLAGTPITEGEKIGIVMSLMTYMHGELRLSLDLAAGYRDNPAAFSRQYALTLKRLVDPREMPALNRVVEAGVFDADNLYDEQELSQEFEFGLSIFLEGVAAHLARREH